MGTSLSTKNRVNLLVAAQPGELGNSFATSLPRDFTLSTRWEQRPLDGWLSHPPQTRAEADPGITHVEIHPRWAQNKEVSLGTDLREWAGAGFAIGTVCPSTAWRCA